MILVTSPSKPFTLTGKHTPRRQVIIKDYETEIAAVYAAAAETTQANKVSSPVTWDLSSTTDFIKTVVNRVMNSRLEIADDIFQKGCDR